jgi:hypothetical protein
MNKYVPPHLSQSEDIAIVGLISDTHLPQRLAALPTRLTEIFESVDLILHAGDVGKLYVLDQLGEIAPVVAVHGNDDTEESQRELPFQQVVSIGGQRILLWHSHFPDRLDEMSFRNGNKWKDVWSRSASRARRAGAGIAVFGHLHQPLVQTHEDILLINPGALAPGGFFHRMRQHSVALLCLSREQPPHVIHVDIDAGKVFTPAQLEAEVSVFDTIQTGIVPITSDRLANAFWDMVHVVPEIDRPRLIEIYLELAHRCWSRERERITCADLLQTVHNSNDLPLAIAAAVENFCGPEETRSR